MTIPDATKSADFESTCVASTPAGHIADLCGLASFILLLACAAVFCASLVGCACHPCGWGTQDEMKREANSDAK